MFIWTWLNTMIFWWIRFLAVLVSHDHLDFFLSDLPNHIINNNWISSLSCDIDVLRFFPLFPFSLLHIILNQLSFLSNRIVHISCSLVLRQNDHDGHARLSRHCRDIFSMKYNRTRIHMYWDYSQKRFLFFSFFFRSTWCKCREYIHIWTQMFINAWCTIDCYLQSNELHKKEEEEEASSDKIVCM